jgi:DNA modification methylase
MQKEIIDNSTLYLGDAYEILPTIADKSVDLVLIDPPYEYYISGGGAGFMGTSLEKLNNVTKPKSVLAQGFELSIFYEILRVLKNPNILCFCSVAQVSKIMSWYKNKGFNPQLLVWYKSNAAPLVNNTFLPDLEYIVSVRRKAKLYGSVAQKSKVKRCPFDTSGFKHPTIKPIALIQELLVNCSAEGDTVLDCFMGSGTTGVACEQMKRKFIGIEIISKYFDIACRRIDAEYNQQKLNF